MDSTEGRGRKREEKGGGGGLGGRAHYLPGLPSGRGPRTIASVKWLVVVALRARLSWVGVQPKIRTRFPLALRASKPGGAPRRAGTPGLQFPPALVGLASPCRARSATPRAHALAPRVRPSASPSPPHPHPLRRARREPLAEAKRSTRSPPRGSWARRRQLEEAAPRAPPPKPPVHMPPSPLAHLSHAHLPATKSELPSPLPTALYDNRGVGWGWG